MIFELTKDQEEKRISFNGIPVNNIKYVYNSVLIETLEDPQNILNTVDIASEDHTIIILKKKVFECRDYRSSCVNINVHL